MADDLADVYTELRKLQEQVRVLMLSLIHI